MNVLNKIVEKKKIEVSEDKKKLPLINIKKLIKRNNFFFKKQLNIFKKQKKIAIIAEIKKASPSKGIFVKNFNHIDIATQYFTSGAACLSILTEKNYFLGDKKYIQDIKKKINLPILCKDFFIDPYQIYEACMIGADCILIILKSSSEKLVDELYWTAMECGLDCIIEVHDEDEMNRAIKYKDAIIGINNRNLETFKTDIQTTIDISNKFKLNDRTLICESGIHSKKDVNHILEKTKISNFLVGESLIKAKSISEKMKELIS
jgi:indole-3-glycerol phosphate synthase